MKLLLKKSNHSRNSEVDKKEDADKTTVISCLETGHFQYPGYQFTCSLGIMMAKENSRKTYIILN